MTKLPTPQEFREMTERAVMLVVKREVERIKKLKCSEKQKRVKLKALADSVTKYFSSCA